MTSQTKQDELWLGTAHCMSEKTEVIRVKQINRLPQEVGPRMKGE